MPLGGAARPMNYRLLMRPDIENSTFEGSVSITVEISKPSDRIALNSKGLDITSCSVLYGASTIPAKSTQTDSDTIVLSLPKKVFGRATIAINFSGPITEKLRGFYRSTYNFNGTKEYMLTTQFEAADARRAFPCFDQPDMKATFNLSLEIDSAYSAVSNMPVSKERATSNGKKLVEFFATPIMSTYLLYFGIGKFEFTKSKYRGKTLRVVTVAGKQRYAQLPLEYLRSFLAFYESYFRIKFPLPKIDMIAVPDFEAGAMENWGAITFRETDLLCDEKSSVAIKQRVVTVIAHEMAHQWFGDLVTMKWWNDLWLNEGFAAFMEVRAPDLVYPSWNMGLRGMMTRLTEAFSMDQLNSTHPVSVDVHSPDEINSIFDNISYAKGSSVISMLEDYAGREKFRKGLISYLKKHAYSNATRSDLWQSVGKESGVGAKLFDKIAKAWIETEGHPVVEVRGPDKKGIAHLTQSRFTLIDKKSGAVWPIPVHYATNAEKGTILMRSRRCDLKVKPGTEYVKLNHMQKGFYRVKYDRENLSAIGRHIRDGIINPVDGWGVEFDLYSIARATHIGIEEYLGFVSEYCMDCGYPMNASISAHLSSLSIIFHGTRKAAKIKETSMHFHRAMLKRLGWNRRRDENQITTLLRGSVIMALGLLGDKSTVDKANSMFMSYVKSGTGIDPNIRGAVYAIAAATGGEATFDRIAKKYVEEQMPDEKRRLLQSLGMFRKKSLITKGLDFSMSGNVRSQDDQTVLGATMVNPYASKLSLLWVMDNWQSIMDTHKGDGLMIGRFIESLSVLASKNDRDRIRRFFTKKENYNIGIKRSLDKTIESIEINMRLLKCNGCSDGRD